MKKILLVLLSLVSAGLTAQSGSNETRVWPQDNKIYYVGDVHIKANETVKLLLKEHKIDTLVITSRGGLVDWGIDLGNIVFDNKLNVQVDKYCNSSCANYVFPAGAIKFLNHDSQLIWHGGASQSMFLSDSELISQLQDDKYREDFIRNHRNSLKKETVFFKKIKVNPQITIAGDILEVQLDMIEKWHKICVWDYSLEVMKQFGIENIVFNNGVWLPSRYTKNGICVYRINKLPTTCS